MLPKLAQWYTGGPRPARGLPLSRAARETHREDILFGYSDDGAFCSFKLALNKTTRQNLFEEFGTYGDIAIVKPGKNLSSESIRSSLLIVLTG